MFYLYNESKYADTKVQIITYWVKYAFLGFLTKIYLCSSIKKEFSKFNESIIIIFENGRD